MKPTPLPITVFIVITVWTSGCLAGNTPTPQAAGPDAVSPPRPDIPVEPIEQTWNGHMRLGAAFEAPAHFSPTDELVRPIWSTGFVIEVTDAPDVLEVRVDWTSAGAGDMMLMVHGPHGAERPQEKGWSEYVTHDASDPQFAAQPPLCMRIPAADIEADLEAAAHHGAHPYWYPMVHSHYGADVKLTFTVTSIGGNVTIPVARHGHDTNVEEIMNIAETEQSPKRPWEPCGPGAGAN